MNKTNIAEYLKESAGKYSDRDAIFVPVGRDKAGQVCYDHLTFKQLDELSDRYAGEFRRSGIVKGVKTLMLLRPGLDFIAAVFAVFKTGAVPVLIDPGMGKKNLLRAIRDTAPEALIAIAPVHWLKLLYRSTFRSIKISFSAGKFAPPWVMKLEKIQQEINEKDSRIEPVSTDDMAAILFTTGSTGPAKGVVYTHGIFIAQTELIRETYHAGPDEMDMPGFPLFALFSAALGMSCVIPDMNPSRPADVDPERIIEAIENHKVTFSFGSPALWRKVAMYCLEKNITLPTLKRVLMAGAPVSAELHEMLRKTISQEGETMVPYGATEALPIVSFTGREMLAETAERTAIGKGYCVGYPLDGITVKIIQATEDIITDWDESLVLPEKKIGEIVVKGPVVTAEYYKRAAQTEAAKIKDPDGRLWHRMGDVGYFDSKGRLWFCGRKGHRVITSKRTYYPVCCEAIFNQHDEVFRTALVGVGEGNAVKPVLIVETFHNDELPKCLECGSRSACHNNREPGLEDRERIIDELKVLGVKYGITADINDFLFHPGFPVDIRHNAKIFREKLSIWAGKKLGI